MVCKVRKCLFYIYVHIHRNLWNLFFLCSKPIIEQQPEYRLQSFINHVLSCNISWKTSMKLFGVLWHSILTMFIFHRNCRKFTCWFLSCRIRNLLQLSNSQTSTKRVSSSSWCSLKYCGPPSLPSDVAS
jgi:hypothetical protein